MIAFVLSHQEPVSQDKEVLEVYVLPVVQELVLLAALSQLS